MSEKVTLPYKIATALEEVKRFRTSYAAIYAIEEGIAGSAGATIKEWVFDNAVHQEMLMSALVNGYEIEQTPEEIVKEYYKQALKETRTKDHETSWRGEAKLEGVLTVITAYGLKIPGINAPEGNENA